MKIKTNNIGFLLLLIIFSQNVQGQFAFNNIEFKLKNPPVTSYKIIQTEKGKLKKILEFNNEGKIIFDYRETEIPPFFNWKEPHRFIYANEYDDYGRIVKRYDFNSNAGLSIYSYKYTQDPLTKTLITQKYTEISDSERNTNAFAFISKFKDFEELKKSKEVAVILSSPEIQGYTEKLNKDEKPVEIVEYSRIYGDTVKTFIEYNSNGDELFKKIVGISNNETKREVITNYEQNSEITEIINFRNGEKTSSYKFAETKNQAENTETEYSESGGVLNIRHKIFDSDGYLIKVTVFETDFKGDLIIPITSELRKTSEMIYNYNIEGLLESEIMTDFKTGKKDKRKYKYSIEETE
jgi:hypothetical protein